MSFWKRLFGKTEPAGAQTPAAPAEDAASAAVSDAAERQQAAFAAQLERVRRCEQAGGASVADALSMLRAARGATQGQVLAAALVALSAGETTSTGSSGLPLVDPAALDPLRLACASMLDQRGEQARALALVSKSRSTYGLMMAADMHAASGDVARAVGAIERVLARNIDAAGARERHQRWCRQLGRDETEVTRFDGATVVAPALGTKSAFRLLREVARGGAGAVYEAEDELLGRRLAYKIYHQAKRDAQQLLREARLAGALVGPGIVRVFDCSPDAGWIAYEWAANGSLRRRMQPAQAAQLLPFGRWLPQLIAAVARIHDAGLVHADIKPENVLFRGPFEPIVSDFGLCVPVASPLSAGTPGYMSPERLDGAPASYADDVYAIGRIIEDALNAIDAEEVSAEHRAASHSETSRYAAAALRCLSDEAERPHLRALLAQL